MREIPIFEQMQAELRKVLEVRLKKAHRMIGILFAVITGLSILILVLLSLL